MNAHNHAQLVNEILESTESLEITLFFGNIFQYYHKKDIVRITDYSFKSTYAIKLR